MYIKTHMKEPCKFADCSAGKVTTYRCTCLMRSPAPARETNRDSYVNREEWLTGRVTSYLPEAQNMLVHQVPSISKLADRRCDSHGYIHEDICISDTCFNTISMV